MVVFLNLSLYHSYCAKCICISPLLHINMVRDGERTACGEEGTTVIKHEGERDGDGREQYDKERDRGSR